MIRYECDWCGRGVPSDQMLEVTIESAYSEPLTLHACHDCGSAHMPGRATGHLSWTAPVRPAPPPSDAEVAAAEATLAAAKIRRPA